MYFKYQSMMGNIEIRELPYIRLVGRRDGPEDGYYIVPGLKSELCEFIDAAINRMAVLMCEPADVVDREFRVDNDKRGWTTGYECVYSQLGENGDFCDSGLAWYETREEALAEMDKIAQAIARGDLLYDLTKED